MLPKYAIFFYDDLFSVNKKRVKHIIELLSKKDLLGRINFSCSIRSNMLNDEIIGLLKEMGVKPIGMGLESGYDDTLKYLKGNNISIRDHENAIKIIKKHKIRIYGSFIIGSPKETKEDILQTLKFIKNNRLDGFDI